MDTTMLHKTIPITDSAFKEISQIVYAKYGIHLTEKKRSLVTGRLQSVLKGKGLTSFDQYIDYLQNSDESAMSELVNRISTNHTFFFREYAHFDFMMKTALPEFETYHQKKGDKNLRVWCAAASSGEEPYTLAMHMMEYFGTGYSQWKAGLLATDISEDALRKAITGQYSSDSVEKIPVEMRQKYFTRNGDNFTVTEALKNEVLYRKFNLMTPQFPFKKNFDLISCRNVMIYFDKETKEELVNKLYDQLRPGGYLFIGHSETLNGLNTPFTYVKSAIYQRRD